MCDEGGMTIRIILCLLLAVAIMFPAAAEVVTKDKDVFDLLLIGTDAHEDDENGRSDAMVLVRLDADAEEIRMVSFLRDLYVTIPGHGKNRLNAAYMMGGAELLLQTLEENFGVTANAWAEVDFAGVTRVIDAIGGVEVEVSDAERVQLNGILRHDNRDAGVEETDGLIPKPGRLLLTGKQALCFSRIRKIDDDLRRTSRQRTVLEAAFHKVMELDILSMAALAVNHLDVVTTNLTAGDIIRLIPLALRVKDAAFVSMTVPGEGAWEDKVVHGMQVLAVDLPQARKDVAAFLDRERKSFE